MTRLIQKYVKDFHTNPSAYANALNRLNDCSQIIKDSDYAIAYNRHKEKVCEKFLGERQSAHDVWFAHNFDFSLLAEQIELHYQAEPNQVYKAAVYQSCEQEKPILETAIAEFNNVKERKAQQLEFSSYRLKLSKELAYKKDYKEKEVYSLRQKINHKRNELKSYMDQANQKLKSFHEDRKYSKKMIKGIQKELGEIQREYSELKFVMLKNKWDRKDYELKKHLQIEINKAKALIIQHQKKVEECEGKIRRYSEESYATVNKMRKQIQEIALKFSEKQCELSKMKIQYEERMNG